MDATPPFNRAIRSQLDITFKEQSKIRLTLWRGRVDTKSRHNESTGSVAGCEKAL